MAKKTEQALKVIASWTPSEKVAEAMIDSDSRMAGFGFRIASGRMSIHCAVALDYTAIGSAERASKWVQDAKAALDATGTLHSFSVAAGAVPVGSAVRLAAE